MSRRVAIVPHTHWDREWYEPFQTFRQRLVETVDSLLDLLDRDSSYRHFLLDGQMAMVDDYLEIRPENRPRLVSAALSGRLSMGPWYVLMDEFLVSAETIVRNLELGLARAAEFAGAMEVGYLPDMFGHVAQMPQIMRLAGISQVVVWRGVPAAISSTGFWWEGPDGSSVRAEYLPVGYSNGSSLPDNGRALVSRASDHVREIDRFLIGDLLYMNGSDHLPPQLQLGLVVAEANEIQDELKFEITSLPAYLETAPTDGLPRWRGELRSGARANLLMGVTSNRVDVKRAVAQAEMALERRAEPYAALFAPPEEWPQALLDLAWRGAILNSAHDSICACSVDEVVAAVLHRTAESKQVALGVADRALRNLAASLSKQGSTIVNPSNRARSGVVELVESARDPISPDVQLVTERPELPRTMAVDAKTMRSILGMMQGSKIGGDTWVHDARIHEDDSGIDVHITIGSDEPDGFGPTQAKQELYTRLGARPDAIVRLSLDQPPVRRIAARAAAVPPFGWRSFSPEPLANPVTVDVPGKGADRPPRIVMGNGLVTVAVDVADGTFSLDGIPGFGRLVDGGDVGDSYNYSPPVNDVLVDRPEVVMVEVGEHGPVRASLRVVSTYLWPERANGHNQSREGGQRIEVTSSLEIRANESSVRVTTSFVNACRDHRLRVHFPLPEPAACSKAECAFGTVTRGLFAEGRVEERAVPTFPAKRFVAAGGLTVVHEGVCEYELVDVRESSDGTWAEALALTVLRSTGMLSRFGMAFRPLPAGPLIAADGLQLLGKTIVFHYALVLGEADPWALADDVLLPLEVLHSRGGGDRPPSGSSLGIRGAEISAVRRHAGALEVRLFNPSGSPTKVELDENDAWEVDLRGHPLRHWGRSTELRPYGIATLRFANR